MKKLLVIVAVIAVVPFLVFAREPDSASPVGLLQAQIQDLLKQIQDLQQQVTELKTELGAQPASTAPAKEVSPEASPPELTRSLSRGSSGEDVRALQKFLSEDRDLYPEGLVTGYYGPLTESAVKRWQARRGLEVVGSVGQKTRAQFKELRGQKEAGIPPTPAAPATPARPVGQTGSTTAPAVSAIPAQSATTTSTTTPVGPTCAAVFSQCRAKTDCEKAGFFWYTVSCHPNPPRPESCAASYNYCGGPLECSAGGWYWCRNSCYGTADACLGQTYVPPAAPALPATPATPAQPVGQTGTTTVPAIPAAPATTTTTISADTTAPSAPTNLTATATSSIQITLSWSPATDNVAVVGYKIYRNGTLLVASLGAGPGMRYYPDTNLQPSTSYTYTVVAYDAAGNVSAQSNQASAVSPSTSVPTGEITIIRPVGGALSLTQGSQYTVRWTASPPTTTGTVNIKLMQSNGSSVIDVYQIASGVPNSGSYLWTVPSNYSGGMYSLSIGNWPSYPYRVSNDFSIVPPTQSTATPLSAPSFIALDKLSNGPAAEPPKLGYAARFSYTLTTDTKSFAVYLKKPSDADFVKYTYDAQIPVDTVLLQWIPLNRTSQTEWYWSPAAALPDTLEIGQHRVYATVTSTAGVESPPSETRSLTVYASPVISNPVQGASITEPFSISWTNGAPDIAGQRYSVYVFNKPGTPFWSTDVSGSVSVLYDGPALNPANNPYRVVVHSYDGNAPANRFANTVSTSFTIAVPQEDVTPPVISPLRVDVAYSSALASWTALVVWQTDENSTTQVEYGVTTSYGTITPLDSSGAFLRTVHSVGLSNLASGTTYHYRMISKDARYNTAVSGDYTFTTGASTASSLDLRSQNLAAVSEALEKIQETLRTLLQGL